MIRTRARLAQARSTPWRRPWQQRRRHNTRPAPFVRSFSGARRPIGDGAGGARRIRTRRWLTRPGRRGEMPLKSVFLSNIPGGTPVKDFVKFRGHPVSSVKEAAFPSMVRPYQKACLERDNKRENIFQSTLITDGPHAKEFFNLSEIKPDTPEELEPLSSLKTGALPLTRNALLKRKACEPLPLESPAKIFSRMKTRAALAKQENKPPERKLLDTKSTTDYILTPERHQALLGRCNCKQKDGQAEEPLGKTEEGRVPSYIAANRNVHLTATGPSVSESPHKFFSRMKQKVQQNPLQRDSSSYQIKDSLPSPAEGKHSLTTLDSGKLIPNHNEESPNSVVGQDDAFIVEAAELDNDTFNTVINATDVSFDPAKSREPVAQMAPGQLPQEGKTSHQGSREPGQREQQGLEAEPQRPSQQLCDIVFATPKVHIPRKQGPAGSRSKAPLATSRTRANHSDAIKEVGGCLMLKWGHTCSGYKARWRHKLEGGLVVSVCVTAVLSSQSECCTWSAGQPSSP
ncbi:hypothetical protein lerEdw1_007535 [Lerista edwardsae]|nr:hypothetical protein lerEdw1_007535 [Lerista edwardsae]